MLNKELLMMGSEPLEPVLSVYISPDITDTPSVSGTLSTGEAFYVRKAGETTINFSDIELTEEIVISYYEDTQIFTSNLIPAAASYSGGVERAPSVLLQFFLIRDRTQSASISLV